jgi:hypothetical protein
MMTFRKWLFSALTAALFILLSVPVWSQVLDIPDGAEGQSYYTAFPVPIEVDGEFADWGEIPYQAVTTGPLMPDNPAEGGSLRFAVAADADNLYLSVQVADAHIVAGQHGIEYWFEDSVEVYINATGTQELAAYAPGVVQLTFPAANIGRAAQDAVIAGTNSEQIPVQAVTVATAEGYAIEAAIPLHTAVWQIVPSHDKRVGFQVQLNGSSEFDRNMKLGWSNTDKTADVSYLNPSVFGELIFFQQSPMPAPETQPANAAAPAENAVQSDMSSSARTRGAGFTVTGSTIYDPSGNQFVAKGVNVSGSNWVWERHTASDADLIDKCWNFNLVRVNSFLFNGEVPYPQNTVNNNLDEIVNTFTARGIVVVFEAHDRIGRYYTGNDLTTLIAWYTDLATRYRDNPYVWFDVMNEPGGRTGIDVGQWVNMHGQVIEAIRSTGANNIIIVEGAYGGQDNPFPDTSEITDSAILKYSEDILSYNGNTFSNVVFSIHTYDLWNQGDAKLAGFFEQVHAQGLALIVGEYGIYTDQDTNPAATSLFNTAPPADVGLIVWHWDGSDHNDLTTTGGGWLIDDCENPTNLSWLGQQVWDNNHAG